jgi:hypothetical protein
MIRELDDKWANYLKKKISDIEGFDLCDALISNAIEC